MKYTVNVAALHIVRGTQSNCTKCPVALALKDATGKQEIEAGLCAFMYLFEDQTGVKKWRAKAYPPGVETWIKAFDMGRPVRPFTFEIELP